MHTIEFATEPPEIIFTTLTSLPILLTILYSTKDIAPLLILFFSKYESSTSAITSTIALPIPTIS